MRWASRLAAGLVILVSAFPAAATSLAENKQRALKQFEEAEQLREALNARPPEERSKRDYQRVTDAYRAVYYGAPGSVRADSAVEAVAELLAQSGRQFHEAKTLQAAVGQYEFLRREYPGSKYRVDALFAIGLIYKNDLHDRGQAKATFEDFLKHYPHSHLGEEARAALTEIEAGSGKAAPVQAAAPAAKTPAVKIATSSAVPTESTKPAAAAPAADPAIHGAAPAAAAKSAPKAVEASHEEAKDSKPAATTSPAATSEAEPARPPGSEPVLTGVRYWTTPDSTRVVIDLDAEVAFQTGRVPNPDRIFFDLHNTKVARAMLDKSFEVADGFLQKIRVGQYQKDTARVVLEVGDISDYSAFLLPNPSRLIIDVHGRPGEHGAAPSVLTDVPAETKAPARVAPAAAPAPQVTANSHQQTEMPRPVVAPPPPPVSPGSVVAASGNARIAEARLGDTKPGEITIAETKIAETKLGDGTTAPLKFDGAAAPPKISIAPAPVGPSPPSAVTRGTPVTHSAKLPPPSPAQTPLPSMPASKPPAPVADKNNADQTTVAALETPVFKTSKPTTAPAFESVGPRAHLPLDKHHASTDDSVHEAAPTTAGDRSMIRALGLKIGTIIIDAGHGGHDTGTVGPRGLQEKDLVLDVALRLGDLLHSKLGANVVYTRKDDTFIPLETRTAIANQNQADLFISIHANSSPDASARGVETYYLNFTSSADALEVAARENAVSDTSIHELQDLVKKIALKDKIDESREFAGDVQKSLWSGLAAKSPAIQNRGVRKAPFVVLIGANMPSILAEISFLSNPTDERKLETPEYRQKIAEYLYRGITRYVNGLSGVKVAQK
jgi:N-acetylmuramoyl-L-alanine amidase